MFKTIFQVSKFKGVLEMGHNNYNHNFQQYRLDYNETIECRECLILNAWMKVEGDKDKKTSFQMQRIQPASGASMEFQSWLRKHATVPKKRVACKQKNTGVNASVVVPSLGFSFKMWPHYAHPFSNGMRFTWSPGSKCKCYSRPVGLWCIAGRNETPQESRRHHYVTTMFWVMDTVPWSCG